MEIFLKVSIISQAVPIPSVSSYHLGLLYSVYLPLYEPLTSSPVDLSFSIHLCAFRVLGRVELVIPSPYQSLVL